MNNEQQRLSISIVCSESHDGEADLSGTPASLREVSQFMIDFVESDRVQSTISTLAVDPAPYDRCLKFLSICKDDGAVTVSIVDDTLKIVGDARRLTTFADWFDFADNTPTYYHCHHQAWEGNEEWVDLQSRPLVIGVGTRSPSIN